MADMMTFPDTWEEYEKLYGFNDSEGIYTNDSRLIPSFRVKQWLDHIAHLESKRQAMKASDLISREYMKNLGGACIAQRLKDGDLCPIISIDLLPSAQPDRDIPKKPKEIMDSTWGIHKKQAVCPKCDYYLGHVYFLGDYKGKRITYCETCGQAIDWEGWDFDD